MQTSLPIHLESGSFKHQTKPESYKMNTDLWMTNWHAIFFQPNIQGQGWLLWVRSGESLWLLLIWGFCFCLFVCLLACLFGGLVCSLIVFHSSFFPITFVKKGLFCHLLSARSGTASIFAVGRHNGNLALEKPEWLRQRTAIPICEKSVVSPNFSTRHYWLWTEVIIPKLISHWTRT